MRLKTNIFSEIFFLIIFVVIAVYFADGGHGTYIPYAIFFGVFSALFFCSFIIFSNYFNNGQGDILLLLVIILFSLSLLQPILYMFIPLPINS
jgi:hypothetical protein